MSQATVAASTAQGGQYLTFKLGGEAFALAILHIKEILEYGRVTEVPMMPPHVRGVINLRGAVVPVVDLAQRLGRAPMAIGRRTCIVIVEVERAGSPLDVGVVVDAVDEVIELVPDAIAPPPSFGAGMRADFIQGMGKTGDGFLVLLHADRVAGADEWSPALSA